MFDTPLQYSCLENPMDGGAWRAAVHGVAEGWTQLSDFTFTFHLHALEKEMATHSNVLAWDSPGKNIGVGCHFRLQCMKAKSENEVAQSCLTFCDPMDCSLPGSSIHGIFQGEFSNAP